MVILYQLSHCLSILWWPVFQTRQVQFLQEELLSLCNCQPSDLAMSVTRVLVLGWAAPDHPLGIYTVSGTWLLIMAVAMSIPFLILSSLMVLFLISGCWIVLHQSYTWALTFDNPNMYLKYMLKYRIPRVISCLSSFAAIKSLLAVVLLTLDRLLLHSSLSTCYLGTQHWCGVFWFSFHLSLNLILGTPMMIHWDWDLQGIICRSCLLLFSSQKNLSRARENDLKNV